MSKGTVPAEDMLASCRAALRPSQERARASMKRRAPFSGTHEEQRAQLTRDSIAEELADILRTLGGISIIETAILARV